MLWYRLDQATMKGSFIEDLPKSICSSMHHHWSSKRSSSMNEPALHADSLRTHQARMNRTACRDDEKPYNLSKPPPKWKRSEHVSLIVEASPSDSDMHMSNNVKAVFRISPGKLHAVDVSNFNQFVYSRLWTELPRLRLPAPTSLRYVHSSKIPLSSPRYERRE